MKKKKLLALAAFVVFAFFSSSMLSRGQAVDQTSHQLNHEYSLYNYIPEDGYISTTGSKYVEASATRILQKGEKALDLFGAATSGTTLVQRLTENSYWAFIGNYTTTFYVGEEGVLLLDPLGEGAAPKVLEAVQSVTDKPITAVVYSHNHADHIGGMHVFTEYAQSRGIPLEIIASDATAQKQAFLNSSLPPATTILALPRESFTFEDQTLTVIGFDRTAHTDDSTMWILEEEGILHVPDYINPDQMPFLGFGGSENYTYFRNNLEAMAHEDWTIFSGGHGNIGWRDDLTFMLNYLDDLDEAVEQSSGMVDWGKLFAAQPNNHAALVRSSYEEQARIAKDLLRPKYGDYYGFEASVPYQVQRAAEALESYK